MDFNNIQGYDTYVRDGESKVPNVAANSFDTSVFAVDFTKGVKKFWYLIVILAVILGSASAYIKYIRYTPMYESSVSFSVSAMSYNINGNSAFSSYYDNNSASQLSKTFPYIVNTSLMKNALKKELKTEYINGVITAEAVASDSNIFKVAVSSNSPEDAFNIVNAIINVYPDVAVFVVGNVKLNILIKPALPSEPYTVNTFMRTGMIFALVGCTLGFGIIALYAFFRNTIRKKEDFKNKLNQKCYVEIPHVIFNRKSNDKSIKNRIVRITDRHPTFKESFRLLRKRLLRNLNEDEKVIAITSPIAKQGKTTVALNLAHTLAIAGKKTACVDLDMRARSLQRYLDYNGNGYTDVINEESDLHESIAFSLEENIDIYFAGNSNVDFSESRFSNFFDFLRNKYDYVIVNMAPGTDVSNSVAVGNLCDCMLLVVKQDSVSIDRIRKTLEFLSFSRARILGFVFNDVQDGFSGYGGYYYGGKYGYGKYGYGKYGYGKYGYGKYGYGYGRNGYGYGYGYGEDTEDESSKHRHKNRKADSVSDKEIREMSETDIPDNNF